MEGEEEEDPPPFQAAVVEATEPFRAEYQPEKGRPTKNDPGKGVQAGRGIKSH